MLRSTFVVLCTLAMAAVSEAADLSEISRKIEREPFFSGKPRYALLALGDAASPVWIVADDEHVYIDRNGNGNLTDKGECMARKPYSVPANPNAEPVVWFKLGDIRTADKTVYREVSLARYNDGEFSCSMHLPNGWRQVAGRLLPGAPRPKFAATPADAPIMHFGGSLTFHHWSHVATYTNHRTSAALRLRVATAGVGEGSLAVVHFHQLLNKDRTRKLTVQANFSGPKGKPILTTNTLIFKQCWDYGYGYVETPPDAVEGLVKFRVFMPEGDGTKIEPAAFVVNMPKPE